MSTYINLDIANLLFEAFQDQGLFDQLKLSPEPILHTNDIFSFSCSKDCLSVFEVNLNISVLFQLLSFMILKGKPDRRQN